MRGIVRASSFVMIAAGLFAGVFYVGCGDSGTSSDAGTDTNTTTDTGGGNDSGGMKDTGGGMDAGMDTGGNMDATSDTGSIALNCQAYCTAIMAACTGNDKQYLDNATCLAMCGKLPVGDAGAMMGGTLACRIYHTQVASQNMQQAATHCPHAGPYGFGGCGGEVENFCLLYAAQCGTFGNGNCTQAAGQINNPMSMAFLTNNSGNTLDCRQYHLENAYQANNMNGMGHCSHANQGGGGVCQ